MDEVTKAKFDNVEAEFKRMSHRLDSVEDGMKSIQKLAISVEKMAVTMQGMTDELKTQGARLVKIEEKPGEKWDTAVSKIVELIIAAALGFALSKLF